MKATLIFAAAASAAVIKRQAASDCCFGINISGAQAGFTGSAGSLGELYDGQIRVGPGYSNTTFCYNQAAGTIVDQSGRGCVEIGAPKQYQCDESKVPSAGITIDSAGVISHNGSSIWYECLVNDQGVYNIYTADTGFATQCQQIKLTTTNGNCAAKSSSSTEVSPVTASAQVSTVTASAQVSTVTASAKVSTVTAPAVAAQVSTMTVSGAGSVTTVTAQATCPAAQTITVTASAPAAATVTVQSSCPASGAAQTVTVTAAAASAQTVTVTAAAASAQTVTVTAAAASAQTVTVTAPAAAAQTVTVTSVQSCATQTQIKATTVVSVSNAVSTEVVPTTVVSKQTLTQSTTAVVTSVAPVSSSSVVPTTSSAVSTSSSAAPTTSSAAPATSSAASTTSSAVSTTSSSAASTSTAAVCPDNLTEAYTYPHLIVPVSSASPNVAYGTQYFAYVNSVNSTIFNIDVESSWAGKTCDLIFTIPDKSLLETTDYTYKSQGSFAVSQLDTVATQQTTYSNMGASTNVGTFPITVGTKTVIVSGSCAAGTTQSFEFSSANGLDLTWFNDWNPCPLGVFMTAY